MAPLHACWPMNSLFMANFGVLRLFLWPDLWATWRLESRLIYCNPKPVNMFSLFWYPGFHGWFARENSLAFYCCRVNQEYLRWSLICTTITKGPVYLYEFSSEVSSFALFMPQAFLKKIILVSDELTSLLIFSKIFLTRMPSVISTPSALSINDKGLTKWAMLAAVRRQIHIIFRHRPDISRNRHHSFGMALQIQKIITVRS